MRMLLSAGSFLYGHVAPAPVMVTPASFASATMRFAQPAGASNDTKYPPRGLLHEQPPTSANASVSFASTSSNFGRKMAACLLMCAASPFASRKKRTWRSWLSLSWPMTCGFIRAFASAMFAALAAMAEMPAPGNVTLLVEANLKQRSGLPASSHAARMSSSWSCCSGAS